MEMYVRLESSCCSPAFMAAAAWREVDTDRGEGEGVWPRRAAASPEFDTARGIVGDPERDIDLEGGREFKSGAIAAVLYGLRCNRQRTDGGEYRDVLDEQIDKEDDVGSEERTSRDWKKEGRL